MKKCTSVAPANEPMPWVSERRWRQTRRVSVLIVSALSVALAACDNEKGAGPGTDPGDTDAGNGSGPGQRSDAGDRGDGGDGSGAGAARLVRNFLGSQVGGLEKLMVPVTDAEIPLPPEDPARPGRYKTTAEKAYLGKLLFHDPVRTVRVNINEEVPLDLPVGTAFGGTVNNRNRLSRETPARIAAITAATAQTGSCGSCHIGEAAGKAGQLLNFNTGGEGRGYTDAEGKFFPRRRPLALLTRLRATPLFEGDALVDALPTLTDIFEVGGKRVVTTPALFYHAPAPTVLLETGRLDQLDSVARLSPSMIGFAFNNRLLFGGFGGEVQTVPGSLNPLNDPAQENLTLLLLDAHRMIGLESAELQKNAAFVQLFREAFPEEAAKADTSKKLDDLVNDETVLRATATFLRTTLTRDTPFDKFIAGDDSAMTAAQLRGAKLFFTPATEGGANCFSCHSGPMLNKQPNDPDVTGVGQFVEENFVNLGIGDHPVQALNAAARGLVVPGHAEDTGREEVTHKAADRYKFRSMTLRQLKDGRQFFHNGSFTSIRDVVQYFNAGIPQDAKVAASGTLEPRFTSPRGRGTSGLGLTEDQVDDLTEFLENGLFDSTFSARFQPTTEDLTYSKSRPNLVALGAKDGVLLSGLAIDDNDPLSRRDQGLEFLDVTNQVHTNLQSTTGNEDTWVIKNASDTVIDTHLLVIVTNLPAGVTVTNATGMTQAKEPYFRNFLPNGVLETAKTITLKVVRSGGMSTSYGFKFVSGQGAP